MPRYIHEADFFESPLFDFKDKKFGVNLYVTTMLLRTQQMFEYGGLPDTIPRRMLESYLQRIGAVCITEYKDNLYAFFGGLGGMPNEYYQPTIYTIANPAFNISKQLTIGTECEIIRNDSYMMGMIPIFRRYATSLVESDISMIMASKNLRAQFALTAPDDPSYKSAQKFIDDLENGELSAMASNEFLEGIRVNPMTSSGIHALHELIENHQYIKASWFNEVGLNANFNMKRENINQSESEMNFDALLPLVDNMLVERQEGVERVNKLYGTNITVKLANVWAKNEMELTKTEEEQKQESNDSERSEEGDSDETAE